MSPNRCVGFGWHLAGGGIVRRRCWVTWLELQRSPGHVFHDGPQAILIAASLDSFVEELCAGHYAVARGRPSLPPGRYFRMLLIGYFEGIDNERGLEWPWPLVARVPAARRARDCAGSFGVEPHALASAAGTARAGVYLGAAPPARARSDQGRADRCGRLDDGGERRATQHRMATMRESVRGFSLLIAVQSSSRVTPSRRTITCSARHVRASRRRLVRRVPTQML